MKNKVYFLMIGLPVMHGFAGVGRLKGMTGYEITTLPAQRDPQSGDDNIWPQFRGPGGITSYDLNGKPLWDLKIKPLSWILKRITTLKSKLMIKWKYSYIFEKLSGFVLAAGYRRGQSDTLSVMELNYHSPVWDGYLADSQVPMVRLIVPGKLPVDICRVGSQDINGMPVYQFAEILTGDLLIFR